MGWGPTISHLQVEHVGVGVSNNSSKRVCGNNDLNLQVWTPHNAILESPDYRANWTSKVQDAMPIRVDKNLFAILIIINIIQSTHPLSAIKQLNKLWISFHKLTNFLFLKFLWYSASQYFNKWFNQLLILISQILTFLTFPWAIYVLSLCD